MRRDSYQVEHILREDPVHLLRLYWQDFGSRRSPGAVDTCEKTKRRTRVHRDCMSVTSVEALTYRILRQIDLFH